MSRTTDRSAAEGLAEGFAQHVEAWARRINQVDAAGLHTLRQAAEALSLATGDGHVCLRLAELADPGLETDRGEPWGPGGTIAQAAASAAPAGVVKALRDTLLASGLVGTPQAPGARPMILDADDRLYLHRYFDHELRLAQRLRQAAGAAPAQIDAPTRERLNQFFAATAAPSGGAPESATGAAPDWQKIAAALALRQRLTVISGGPGTGKTTTVVNLLACLIAQEPECRIALAAPTGKAAARLTEAIRQRAGHLPPDIRAKLPAESFTIHRLLGVTPAPGGFVHHAGHPLAIDALVVDEASMLDLAMARRLLEAVPPTARIILLGDKDQLAAVESGAVFAELSADPSLSRPCVDDLAAWCALPAERLRPAAPSRDSPLHDSVVWFTRNFRFAADSGIGRLAADINASRAQDAINWLRAGEDTSARWIDDGGDAPGAEAMQHLLDGYAPYLETVRHEPADFAAIAKAFDRFRVLCAVREGPRGVNALNDRVTQHAREQLAVLLAATRTDTRSPWYPGRPVMVLRNDHVLKLFNGDIGIVLPDADGSMWVRFPDNTGGFRAISPVRLPPHQSAFAMTVHKAQGSEFDDVLVMLPGQRSRVLTRELLYTAVTRAKQGVALCAGAGVLAATMQASTRRRSGLLARLRELAAGDAIDPGAGRA